MREKRGENMKEAQKKEAQKEKIEELVIVAKKMNSVEIQRVTDIATGMQLAIQTKKGN